MNILNGGFTQYTMTLGVLLAGFAPAKCSSKGCNKQTTKEKLGTQMALCSEA